MSSSNASWHLEAFIKFVREPHPRNRFKTEAEQVLEAAQTLEDLTGRMLLADLSRAAEQRATLHQSLAEQQERDLGVRCHCPNRNRIT